MKRSRLDGHEPIQSAVTSSSPLPWTLPEPANGPERPSRDPVNMLVPRPVADAFKHFCKIERYSYPEALEEIMKRAGLLPRDFGGSA